MQTIDPSPLPPIVQQELYDFYQFLLGKYASGQSTTIPQKIDFKTFILGIPKIEGLEFERQRDFPKDIQL